MDRPGEPRVETTGKVLTFPTPGAEPEVDGTGTAEVNAAHARRLKRGLGAWFEGTWVLLAWILVARRLSSAVRHREVFGVEDSTAFLLVVSMPLIRARRIAAALGHAARALHPKKREAGDAGPEGSKPRPPGVRGRRARKRDGRP
jgi:hypothetical protein